MSGGPSWSCETLQFCAAPSRLRSGMAEYSRSPAVRKGLGLPKRASCFPGETARRDCGRRAQRERGRRLKSVVRAGGQGVRLVNFSLSKSERLIAVSTVADRVADFSNY